MQSVCHSDGACKDSISRNVHALNDLHITGLLKDAGYDLLCVWTNARDTSLHSAKQIFGKLPWFFHWRSDYIKWKANCVTVVRKTVRRKWRKTERKKLNSESMWLTCVSQLQPLLVWICIQSGTWKTQQCRQTMDKWLIRCVRLLSEKVRAEIKRHFEHPHSVYWKGAGMQRMSPVWVCPWMKSAHKMRPRQPTVLITRGWMLGIPVFLYTFTD